MLLHGVVDAGHGAQERRGALELRRDHVQGRRAVVVVVAAGAPELAAPPRRGDGLLRLDDGGVRVREAPPERRRAAPRDAALERRVVRARRSQDLPLVGVQRPVPRVQRRGDVRRVDERHGAVHRAVPEERLEVAPERRVGPQPRRHALDEHGAARLRRVRAVAAPQPAEAVPQVAPRLDLDEAQRESGERVGERDGGPEPRAIRVAVAVAERPPVEARRAAGARREGRPDGNDRRGRRRAKEVPAHAQEPERVERVEADLVAELVPVHARHVPRPAKRRPRDRDGAAGAVAQAALVDAALRPAELEEREQRRADEQVRLHRRHDLHPAAAGQRRRHVCAARACSCV